MSLSVLKRKTQHKYSNHSGNNGFSLNNSRRLDIHYKQNQTPFLGVNPKGHGGCCDTYKINVNKTHYGNEHDPFHLGRPSVKSSSSYLNQKKKCSRQQLYINKPNSCPSQTYPNIVVQTLSDSNYEYYLKEKVAKLNHEEPQGNCSVSRTVNSKQIGNYKKDIGPLDYQTYLSTRLKKNKCLDPPKQVYPPSIQRNTTLGCYNYLSEEDYKKQTSC